MKLRKKYKLFLLNTLSAIIFFLLTSNNTAIALSNETSLISKIDKESFLNADFLFLDIQINGATSTFNSVLASISYDPDIIEVENIIYDNSFCSLTATSSIDNLNGQTTIICGNPIANASSTSQIARLKIKKIQEGFVTIKLAGSKVLSANGLANNILDNIENHTLMIIKEL